MVLTYFQDILWFQIYEIHIFELRNEEINVKKILAVINGQACHWIHLKRSARIETVWTLIVQLSSHENLWKNYYSQNHLNGLKYDKEW